MYFSNSFILLLSVTELATNNNTITKHINKLYCRIKFPSFYKHVSPLNRTSSFQNNIIVDFVWNLPNSCSLKTFFADTRTYFCEWFQTRPTIEPYSDDALVDKKLPLYGSWRRFYVFHLRTLTSEVDNFLYSKRVTPQRVRCKRVLNLIIFVCFI